MRKVKCSLMIPLLNSHAVQSLVWKWICRKALFLL